MNRNTRSENGDLTSPRSSRAASISSEKTSMSSAVMIPTPAIINPPPAYVAIAAASEIVTDQHNLALREQFGLNRGSSPIEDVALFSEGALTLVNSFLDNLLLTFLATARASTLSALRPAIVDVLKSKLAREAIASADQELQDLLAGEPEDEQDEEAEDNGAPHGAPWDLLKVWKRARLRIMVYTRLGAMEEEDEVTYIAELETQDGVSTATQPASTQGGIVSWAAAIFLTSVIEYVAEQALNVCGQAAFARAAGRRRKSVQSATTDGSENRPSERVVIEEHDAEKIALNSTLGRLWRTWRKRARGSTGPTSPHGRRTPAGRFPNSLYHQASFDESVLSNEEGSRMSMDREVGPIPTETEIAANIPLPMTERDVDEIEVPGLAKQVDDDDDETDGMRTPAAQVQQRPLSMLFLASPRDLHHDATAHRKRPLSLPPPPMSAFELAQVSAPDDVSSIFETPMETAGPEGETYVATEDLPEDRGLTIEVLEEATIAQDSQTQDFARVTSTDVAKEDAVVQSRPADAAVANRSSSRHSSRSTTAGIVDHYARDSRASFYHEDYDMKAIGLARTSDVPIAPSPKPDQLSANISGTDLVDMPNVEYYLEKNPGRPESTYLAPAPKDAIRSTDDVSPMSEHAPRTSSRNALSRVNESLVVNTPAESATSAAPDAAKSPVSLLNEVAHEPKPDDSTASVPSVPSRNGQPSDETERAYVQRVRSESQATSVGSSILHMHRASESSVHPSKGFDGRMSEDDRQREFDNMVKREETVKYTLTPQSVRDDHSPTSPPHREASNPVTKVTVYRPQEHFGSSTTTSTHSGTNPAPVVPVRKSPPSSARPPSTNTKRWGPVAREPRVQTETMRDFADFIRSTGPNREAEVPQPILAATSSPGTKSSLGRRLSSRTRSSTTGSKVKDEGPTARPRKHLEPRSPVSPSNESGELINFIRQGPPSTKSGEHRIARSVAPFRSTMDSDEFNNLYSDHATPPESVMSTASVATTNNTNNTNNSRTGLLSSSSKISQPPPQQSSTGAVRNNILPPPDSNGPTRTRRRVKDPYAIDLSDDEDDLLTSLPNGGRPPQKRQEESLIDFLKNVDPPAQNDPSPLLPSARNKNGLSLNNASTHQRTPYDDRNDPRAPPLSPLAAHPQQPRYGPFGGARQAPAGGPRDSRQDTRTSSSRKTDTSDLADFLRSSGPPEMPAAASSRPGTSASKSSQKNGWQFWKKKGVA